MGNVMAASAPPPPPPPSSLPSLTPPSIPPEQQLGQYTPEPKTQLDNPGTVEDLHKLCKGKFQSSCSMLHNYNSLSG